jgi:hypothetical protein
MRIESAFIADHTEVNPATRTLDVRSGFQSSTRVPKLPFRHVLALALVIQVASDDYGRAFTLGIDVNRVDELPVMLHQDFSFEIPRGIHAADGVSHHYPFAFSLPVDFYDVGLHSAIVGDEDSDVAHVPFIVQIGHPGRTLTGGASHEPWAILCRHPPVPEVGEHSANPCLIAASETGFQGGNPQFREPIDQFCSGSLVQSTAGDRSRQDCSR